MSRHFAPFHLTAAAALDYWSDQLHQGRHMKRRLDDELTETFLIRVLQR
jgi:hypothetical protein